MRKLLVLFLAICLLLSGCILETGPKKFAKSYFTVFDTYTTITGYASSQQEWNAVADGLYHLLRKESMRKGVHVDFHQDNSISIDLHIIVDNGVNLTAVGNAIISEVRYVVNKCTNTEVRGVNVYIDSMMGE